MIDYEMVSDRTTIVNSTNHSYFNLDGHDSGKVLKHELEVYADACLETDEELIPTGKIVDVTDTSMDFRDRKKIGQDIEKGSKTLCREKKERMLRYITKTAAYVWNPSFAPMLARKRNTMIDYLNMTIKQQKNIALIAHDGKKQEMLKWCEANKAILKKHKLSGIGTTARMISDPLAAQPHDPDVKALLRIAQVYDIPIANNISTADFIIRSTLMDEEYTHQVENFKATVENRAKELSSQV